MDSVSGQGAFHILYLDLKKDTDLHFNALRRLVDENPNDMILRWMIAVQCRAYGKNEEGVKHYLKLLEKWNPGPSLVHQTYGNLLDELNRHEDALAEHRKAVELEPKGWSYQALGNTLVLLNRCTEANEAFRKSVEYSPDRSEFWQSWAWGLLGEGKFQESIAKCEKAIALNPENSIAWEYWGRCLELQGKLQDALQKYRKSVMLNGTDKFAKDHIKDLEEKIASRSNPVGDGNVPTK
jgi:tetratricopeptide (TPR) repeat protein